jgi:hypothetical protein
MLTMEIMGHRSAAMTDAYDHASIESKIR